MTRTPIAFKQILSTLGSLGPLGPLAFIPLYVIGTLILVPTSFMNLAAGALFGLPIGFVLASLASLTSAAGVFLAGRYLSRKWLLKKIVSNKKIMALENAITKEGWKMVLLLRFSFIVPFSVMNYSLGLSKIHFKHYILASWLGMTPATFLYVYLGSFAGKIVFENGQRQTTLFEWIFFVFGLAMTLGGTLYAASIVKKTLQTHEKSTS